MLLCKMFKFKMRHNGDQVKYCAAECSNIKIHHKSEIRAPQNVQTLKCTEKSDQVKCYAAECSNIKMHINSDRVKCNAAECSRAPISGLCKYVCTQKAFLKLHIIRVSIKIIFLFTTIIMIIISSSSRQLFITYLH